MRKNTGSMPMKENKAMRIMSVGDGRRAGGRL